MKANSIEILSEKLTELNLDSISVCFTYREMQQAAQEFIDLHGGAARNLSDYWKGRAASDPELATRLLGTYLERLSKAGVPDSKMNCNAHSEPYSLHELFNSPGPSIERSTRHQIRQITGEDLSLSKFNQNPTISPPGFHEQVSSFTKSMSRWTMGGFNLSSPEEMSRRKDICVSCEFWDSSALNGSGRCLKCGCSTWAKIRMGTESCPIGKW